ncbi:MAG: NAD(P)H-hydrate dehydratase [Acidimicrobiales bacterium]|jgi:NAD(P)H-hydrate epimerase
MIPILSSSQMRDADARAVGDVGVDALVNAAGTAVGLTAATMLGSCYGARVAVLAGPGLNGRDGRVSAHWLKSRGARVDVIEVASQPASLEGYDLVIDAAFGLGCSRAYVAPHVGDFTPVLAVDLPSGLDSDSGEILGSPLTADVTLALGALKPAHVNGPGAALVGELRFAGLGIVSEFDDGLVEDRDLESLISIGRHDHKWVHAVEAFVGSPLMPGAAELVVRGALAGGASMIRLASRGDISGHVRLPPEVVHGIELTADRRCRAVVAGPGLGFDAASWLRERLADVDVPVVLDADGLDLSLLPTAPPPGGPWILTPHDGEFARLTGRAVPANRLDAVRALARDTKCVVLLKGPTTILANPNGTLRVVMSGTPALATAGSGDVLAGLIAATIARGHDVLSAGALAAHLHGRAGARLGVYAPSSDLPSEVREILELLR